MKETSEILEIIPALIINKNICNARVVIFFHAKKRPFLSADINASCLQNSALMAHAKGLGSIFPNPIIAACERNKTVPQLINLPGNQKV